MIVEESKRRAKLDPNYGKVANLSNHVPKTRQAEYSFTSSKA
jgi:hypothetical protein